MIIVMHHHHDLFSILENAVACGGPAESQPGERLLLVFWWLLHRMCDEFNIGRKDAIDLVVALAEYEDAQG